MILADRTISSQVLATLLFAATAAYPNRVSKLVYLDAASDWARMHELMADAHIPYAPYASDSERKIDTEQSHPDFTKVTVPALAFFVMFAAEYGKQSDAVLCPGCLPEAAQNAKRFWDLMFEKDFWNEQEDEFQRTMKHGRVITLHGTNHFFFQDPKQIDSVVREMRMFLLNN
jgi:hypothetical protein